MKAKLLLASALGLSLLGGAAIAQTQTPPPPPPGGPAAAAPKDDARMAPDDDEINGDAEDDASDIAPPPPPPGGPRDMDRRGPKGPRHGGPGHRFMMPPPPSKAAHFRIENGPFRFDVKCAENEPMQACADIALRMFEQAKTLPAPPAPPAR